MNEFSPEVVATGLEIFSRMRKDSVFYFVRAVQGGNTWGLTRYQMADLAIFLADKVRED